MINLIRRDGPYCHLCGYICDVRPNHKGGAKLQASQDHVIPASSGEAGHRRGRLEELKLAHRMCNNNRRDAPITEALRVKLRRDVERHFSPDTIERLRVIYEEMRQGLEEWREKGYGE